VRSTRSAGVGKGLYEKIEKMYATGAKIPRSARPIGFFQGKVLLRYCHIRGGVLSGACGGESGTDGSAVG
jgi:hypothetical protein